MTWLDLERRLIAQGPPDEYVKPPSEIAADLYRWPTSCRGYDSEPETWFARARARARDSDSLAAPPVGSDYESVIPDRTSRGARSKTTPTGPS